MSGHSKSLIRLLLSDAHVRLGRNGVDEVRQHAFFRNDEWTWETLENGLCLYSLHPRHFFASRFFLLLPMNNI